MESFVTLVHKQSGCKILLESYMTDKGLAVDYDHLADRVMEHKIPLKSMWWNFYPVPTYAVDFRSRDHESYTSNWLQSWEPHHLEAQWIP